ncbi:MAG TPA: Crp/Fnr family transcriptional regulator [Thermoflexales bacterium]|nr:Crp/Fnr family transcriptional regulator [Thermoflexales bacterium]HQX10278.1 Crp/Fnr family transcriptional regulator [Thermoflexales bacterium]HQY23898.1 Crp/Fnr family transcriptional regulator [Thermoflexales bacterium]HRA53793.1 Crp/Fnr family transcriptional regulator [Thermoflexales bacterium]
MDELQSMIAGLRSVQHFARMSEDDLRTIVLSGQMRHFKPGETVFLEGAPCAGMHVLTQGQVQLRKLGPQGKVNIIATIEPVIMFNEVAVLDGGVNPASALAIEDSLIWQISHAAFQTLLQRYPAIGLGLLRVLAARNRLLMSHYEDLAFRTIVGRMAKHLVDLSQMGAQPIARRSHSIEDMAGRVACAPEAVSRALATLKHEGVIACNRSQIRVTHPDRLAALANLDLRLPTM